MKPTFLFSLLIICISCFSCNKKNQEIKDYKKSLIGDWDWVSSTSGKNGGTSSPLITNSPSTTNTNYGLRIRRNDHAFLYENGKQIKKGKLEGIKNVQYSQYSGGKTSVDYHYQITFNFDGETMIFTEGSTGLTCTNWPYNDLPNLSNNFKKN